MESYTKLDLYLNFVCFFRNERLCVDRSKIKSIFYQLPSSRAIFLAEYYHWRELFFLIVNFNNLKSQKNDCDTKQYRN